MKIIYFYFILSLLACREMPPTVDFSIKGNVLKDETFINTIVPVPDQKKIFLEELTGVNCSNCPKAAKRIQQIDSINLGNAVAVAAYPFALATLTAPWPGFEVLNTNIADDIFSQIYNNPTAIPMGGVNRKVFAGETSIAFSESKWSGYSELIKKEESSLNIGGRIIKYDPITHNLKINVNVVFTKQYKEQLNLTLYIIENKIISKQTMPYPKPNDFKDDYVHNHVLRKAITPFNGSPLKINASTIGNYEVGRTFEKEFDVQLDPKWRKENCAIVILVNRFDIESKEVLQAAEIDLQ